MKPLSRRTCLQLLTGLFFSLVLQLGLAAPPPPVKDGFTLVVLPDTQNYAWKFPHMYEAQSRWIVENVKKYNIQYVLHVGDVTQHNTNQQWQVARQAHAALNQVVPCAITPGNHDLGLGGRADSRQTLFSEFFPLADFQKWKSFGGVYDREPTRTENNYHLFRAGGRDWLVLALEFGPRNDVVRWANEVVAKHPRHSVILVTHAYLRPDNSRFDRRVSVQVKGKAGNKGLDQYQLSRSSDGFNDGEDLWQKLVSQHRNFALVISGHVCISGRLTSTGRYGNLVHQMVVDYQNQPNGGNGFLRLLQFLPDQQTVRIRDYSVTLDETIQEADRVFDLQLNPAAH